MDRRAWLLGGSAALTATAYPFFRRTTIDSALDASLLTRRQGPLLLREGFGCKVLAHTGQRLHDGTRSADLPDGMACFSSSRRDEWILMRNHELEQAPRSGAYPEGAPAEAFDPVCQGGVSRLVVEAKTLTVRSSNTILTGTHRNCGGGLSPWGFLSCEESRLDGHGYVFLCRPDSPRVARPEPIYAYGRYRHEAACVDPTDLRAYLTEDEVDGCFYRFTPTNREAPFDGILEALIQVDQPGNNGGQLLQQGDSVAVDWVPVSDPLARTTSVREQARKRGAAPFVRSEGVWLAGSSVVFSCTEGGRAGLGQLFHLDTEKNELTLLAESQNAEDFAHPDNVTISPWGDVIFSEDALGSCCIRGVTASGQSYPIALNHHSGSEIAGVCFSPDGSTLFCNLQRDGLTLAIFGPFETLWDSVATTRSQL